jgi:GT2 family glycosyltransferase
MLDLTVACGSVPDVGLGAGERAALLVWGAAGRRESWLAEAAGATPRAGADARLIACQIPNATSTPKLAKSAARDAPMLDGGTGWRSLNTRTIPSPRRRWPSLRNSLPSSSCGCSRHDRKRCYQPLPTLSTRGMDSHRANAARESWAMVCGRRAGIVMPAVSVLIPAFNAAATLEAALRSVERQSDADFECVVVDDGSSDATLDIARRFAAKDGRFRVLELTHGGIVTALNTGLEQCRGELVARMDADDLMQRRRLEKQRAALARHPDWAGLGCHVRLFPRRAMTQGLRSYERWLCSIRDAQDVAREAFIECPLAHPTLMLRADVFRRYGYRDLAWPEDYDLVLRLLGAGESLGSVPQRLLHWRDGSGRLSRSSERYSIAAFTRCKAEFLARGFLGATERYVLWGYGDTGKALAAALAEQAKLPSAIVELHPGRLGQLIRGVRVIAPEGLPKLPRQPLLVSVAGLVPRREIRAALAEMGFAEGRDFVCCA